ncbi:MAG: lysozyme inhibitor LprI family protein [Casimicrobiaceae bacterium]
MNSMTRVLIVCAGLTLTAAAKAGALDECMIKGDHPAVTRCLLDADKEAQAALVKAEGDAGKKARDLDVATGRSGAAAALARSMRAFADYRKAQCDFIKAMYASGNGADQGQLGCQVDLTRRRVRDLAP